MRIKQIPNYELIIKTNRYTGNFERELISYALGTLDDVQMEMGDFHGEHEMNLFWEEEFNSERKNYYEDIETYRDFLNSDYFLSLHVIDGSKIAIFCKNETILDKIKAIYMQFTLNAGIVKEIETVPLNVEMTSYSNDLSICLWTI